MSQKTNSMIKLALVFFICLLSFSIGTYVGKKYSDNQYKLAQLEPHKKTTGGHDSAEFATNSETESHSEKHEGSETQQKLTDSEVAKIAEEFANDQPTEPSHDEKKIQTVESDETPIKTVAEKATHTSTKAMPTKIVSTHTTTTTAHDQREPSSVASTAKTSTGGQFTVQIGSFPTESDAQKLTKEMLAKGIKTSYVNAQVKGQTYFRVNVGLFGTAKEADEYKKDFLEKTKLTSAFVQKVQ